MPHRRIVRALVAVVTVVTVLLAIAAANGGRVAASETPRVGAVHVLKQPYEFSAPWTAYGVGGRVWVPGAGATYWTGTTMLSPASGAKLRTITNGGTAPCSSTADAVDGSRVWALLPCGPTRKLVELNGSTGAVVRTLQLHVELAVSTGCACLAASGHELWVVWRPNTIFGALTRVDLTNGASTTWSSRLLERAGPLVLAGGSVWVGEDRYVARYRASTGAPLGRTFLPEGETGIALAAALGSLFIPGRNALTVVSTATGAITRQLAAKFYGFHDGGGIATNGSDVWVTNAATSSITEVDASTGRLLGILKGPRFGFDLPRGLTYYRGKLWVANYGGGSVTSIASP
jgi:hypothetical protein